MSKSIDERVVQMQFDNQQFEKGVKTSIDSLSNLKKGLDLSNSSKGLTEVANAAKRVTFNGISDGIETVKLKFSALEIMGITALTNITNQAVNAGKRIISALTIDPIKSGFSEYETQINAIQTILANTSSKGTTLDQVNSALDELNLYADKTIYNFTEMTRNIGTFTAAGIDLDTAVSAIKGIANLAAVSGSTSQQASTAMYQLSQALSSGTVKLMDWNSVVNAGMGGQVFQDALKETARLHGISIDKMIKDEGSFRETLQKGWLTADILTETLNKFTGDLTDDQLKELGYTEDQIVAIQKMGTTANDAATKVKTFTQLFDTLKEAAQSGWTSTWELIVGDFDQAKSLLTSISDSIGAMIGESANARNAILTVWKAAGGRRELIRSFRNIFKSIMSIVTPVKEAFSEIFPSVTGIQLKNMTVALRDFTSKLILSEDQAKNLKNTFKGLFAILDIGKQIIKAVWNLVKPLFGTVSGFSSSLLEITGSAGEWLVQLDETIKKTDIFNEIIKKVTGFISLAHDKIKSFLASVKENFKFPGFELFHAFLERFQERLSGVENILDGIKVFITSIFEDIANVLKNSKILSAFEAIWKIVKIICGGIFDALAKVSTGVIDKVANTNFSNIVDLLSGLSLGAIALGIKNFLDSFKKVSDTVGSFKEGVLSILDGVRGCFEAYQTQLKAGALMKIATAIAILVASILVLSFIDSDKLLSSVGAITALFAELAGTMTVCSKMFGGGTKGVFGLAKLSVAMIAMSVSVLILASALKKIGDIDLEDLVKGVAGVFALCGMVIMMAKALNKVKGPSIKGAVSIVIFAAAINILASVCEDFGKMDWNEIAKGLAGVAGLMVIVSVFSIACSKWVKGTGGKLLLISTSMVIMGAALKILASACNDFASMEWEELGKAGAAIAAFFGLISGFGALSRFTKGIFKAATSMVIISAALLILVPVCKGLSSLDWMSLGKAGAAIGVFMALVAGFGSLSKFTKGIFKAAVAMVVMASALAILVPVCKSFASMEWEELGKAGASIIVLMGAMVAFGALTKSSGNILIASAAMVVMAIAIGMLVPSISLLGAMKLSSLLKGLGALAATFVILGVAGALLGPLVPVILGLAGSLALIGLSVVAVGGGLILIGLGLQAISIGIGLLAASLAAGTAAIVAGLVVVVKGIVDLIPTIVIAVIEGLKGILLAIVDLTPILIEAVIVIVKSVVKAIVECVPDIVGGVLELVSILLSQLAEYIPGIIDSLADIIVGIFEGLARNLPKIIKAAVKVLTVFVEGLFDALGGCEPDNLVRLVKCFAILIGAFVVLAAASSLCPKAIITTLAMVLVVGLISLMFVALSKLPLNKVSTIASSLSKLLLSISASMLIISMVPITGALTGIAGLAIVIAGLVAILAVLGGLAQIPGFDWLMGEGTKVLGDIGFAIGSFVGNIIGGFVGGVSEGFPVIAENLSEFMEKAQPFIEGAKGVDEGSMNGVKMLAETVLILTAVDILNGLASWLTGGSSIVDFGKDLAEFAPYLIEYADTVKGIDSDSIESSANAAKMLAEFAKDVPNEGGLLGMIMGENDIGEFGKKLAEFGPGLMEYAESVKGLDAGVVENSANAAKTLIELSKDIPNSGGLLGMLMGDNDMATFGDNLAYFGPKLMAYATAVSGLKANVVTNSANAASAMAAMADDIPNSGGLVKFFVGSNDISTFGDRLEEFGESFARYYVSISTIDTKQLGDVIFQINRLLNFAKGAADLDTDGMTNFGSSLTKLGESGVDGIVTTFEGSSERVTDATATMFSYINNEITTYQPDLLSRMNNLLNSVITAINSQRESVISVVKGIIGNCIIQINMNIGNFTASGENVINGFINGMNSKISDVVATAKGVGTSAYTAINEALDIRSPSRKLFESGMYADLGFAGGLSRYSKNVNSAASKVGNSALDAIKESISGISEAINGDIDNTPTIRPVLDLTNVETGAKRINSLFSADNAMKVATGLSATEKENQISNSTGSTTANTYQFTQNNYSPKALSRIDIYRQTKNQFATLKGSV